MSVWEGEPSGEPKISLLFANRHSPFTVRRLWLGRNLTLSKLLFVAVSPVANQQSLFAVISFAHRLKSVSAKTKPAKAG
ncbi:MAG: hypothetical protein YYHSYBAR_002487 [Candidatus Fervidibacter sacchari]